MPLDERWRSFANRIPGLTDPGAAWAEIARHYTDPGRAYHNLEHVAHCLAELDKLRSEASDPLALEAALWFHDAIYDPRAKDNEAQSAALAADRLRAWGQPDAFIARVEALILATRHAATPPPGDPAILVDCDLAILGAPRETFDAYERAVREEYTFVPDPDFRAGRRAILRQFLARPRIFVTDRLFDEYETRARENLARSLAQLSAPAHQQKAQPMPK